MGDTKEKHIQCASDVAEAVKAMLVTDSVCSGVCRIYRRYIPSMRNF